MDNAFFEKLEEKKIYLDGCDYQVFLKRQESQGSDSPRLIVVSYLPDKKSAILLRLCIDTIQKFTDIPYELWVVDNNSPKENIDWLTRKKGINLVLNTTKPAREGGSYANAIGLEIGRALIDQDSRYLMTLHQDTVACRKGWLTYLLSKLNEKTKAVGVRMDTARVPEGILHVLGYIVDFQLFKRLNLSFFPDLPKYDVGDKAIMEIRKAGYEIFATPNSIWDETVAQNLPENSPFKRFPVDRSVDDDGNVIFIHLGRGVVKSLNGNDDEVRSIGKWAEFVRKNILFQDRPMLDALKKRLLCQADYSVRRYFVDRFFVEHVSVFCLDEKILDIGGKKEKKRGYFDIGTLPLSVEYANIDTSTNPDYLCDAASIPVPDNSYDGVILAEVLEHIREPKVVLAEAFRVLKPDGKLLITVPFLYHVHGDPNDYGRYTEHYWREVLGEVGFGIVGVERQGGYYATLANMFKMRLLVMQQEDGMPVRLKRTVLSRFLIWFQKKAFKWDGETDVRRNKILSGHTTGYGIECRK